MVNLENRPGALADIAEALGNADVNIEALQCIPFGEVSLVHVVADDDEQAAHALIDAGIRYMACDAISLGVLDAPGKLGQLARRFADEGINIESVTVGVAGRVIVGVTDVAAARRLARSVLGEEA